MRTGTRRLHQHRGRGVRSITVPTIRRGPITRANQPVLPGRRPAQPSLPMRDGNRPLSLLQAGTIVRPATPVQRWQFTDRGLALIMGIAAVIFGVAVVFIISQFIALGAPLA